MTTIYITYTQNCIFYAWKMKNENKKKKLKQSTEFNRLARI